MTEPDKPFHQTKLGMVVACAVWTAMLGTAVIEVSLLTGVITQGATSLADEISLYVSVIAIALMWLGFLAQEWIYWYDRRKARAMRRLGFLAQGLLLSLNGLGGYKHMPNVFAALFVIFLSTVCWHAWMSTVKLHPEDQKVVDELIAVRDKARSEAFGAQQGRARESQLKDALASIRYTPPAPASQPDHESAPPAKWKIPRGQHEPVVYFIRNGNRTKIGTTTDLYQRIRRLAVRAEHVALLLPGGRNEEQALHRQFAALRVGNTEWFRDEPPLTDFITDQARRAATDTTKEV